MKHVYARGEVHTGLLWGNRKERVHFGDLLLKCILKKQDGSLNWINLDTDRKKLPECCEAGNKHSGPVRCGTFFNELRNDRLLNNCLATCSYLITCHHSARGHTPKSCPKRNISTHESQHRNKCKR